MLFTLNDYFIFIIKNLNMYIFFNIDIQQQNKVDHSLNGLKEMRLLNSEIYVNILSGKVAYCFQSQQKCRVTYDKKHPSNRNNPLFS